LMLIAENMLSTLDISTRLDMFGRMQGLAGRLVVVTGKTAEATRRGGKRDIKETWVGQLKRALTEHKYTMLTEPSALPDRGPGELDKDAEEEMKQYIANMKIEDRLIKRQRTNQPYEATAARPN
jgi:hypothetical protein